MTNANPTNMPIRVSTITSCFRGERYLRTFLENVTTQTLFSEMEVVLVHNEPNEAELAVVRDFLVRYPDRLQHIIVNPVEPLGVSWNRAWGAARGEYVCVWNVDDLRVPDSLARQADVLDREPDVALVYGDCIWVTSFGSTDGELRPTPEFNRNLFLRCYHEGPFPMWRKSLGEQVGFFDEQLRSACDFDLCIRIAYHFPMRRVPGVLGYFTNEGVGLSTHQSTGNRLALVELTVIELRYEIYETDLAAYAAEARQYRIHELFYHNDWHPVMALIPGYERIIATNHSYRAIARAKGWIRRWCKPMVWGYRLLRQWRASLMRKRTPESDQHPGR